MSRTSFSSNAEEMMEETMEPVRRGQRMSARNSQMIDELTPLQLQRSMNNDPPPMHEIDHTKHSFTDVPCLIIFVCCIVFWFYIAHFAFTQGDLNKVILIGTDSYDRTCGMDSGVTQKPYLYFFDFYKCSDPKIPIVGCQAKRVCVEQCPQESFMWDAQVEDRELEHVRNLLICDEEVDKNLLQTPNQISTAIEDGSCSGLYVKSNAVHNYCLPFSKEDLCDMARKFLKSHSIDEYNNRIAEMCRKDNDTEKFFLEYLDAKDSQVGLTKMIAVLISGGNDTVKSERLVEDIMNDLKSSWKVILMSLIIQVLLAVTFIALLQWLAKPLVWFSILGVLVVLMAVLVYGIQRYKYYSQHPTLPQQNGDLMEFQILVENKDFWLWVNVLTGAVLTIIVLIVVVLRKRIGVAVSLIKEASKAITSIKSTIFFPIFPGILYILVSILCGIVALYLNTIGTNSFRIFADPQIKVFQENCECEGPAIGYKMNQECDPHIFETNCHIVNTNKNCMETVCRFGEIVKTPRAQWFFYFCVFTYLWVILFISAYGDMVLACAFSMWYWTFDKKKLPTIPLLKAVGNVTLYHLGTIAFGSLILAIVCPIRRFTEMIEKHLKTFKNKHLETNNRLIQALLCCVNGVICLLENVLRFLNRNSYITCAIHSASFFASSQKAFALVTQNKVSGFLLLLSKLLLTSSTCFATYWFLTAYPTAFVFKYPLVPIIFVALSGYIMSEVVFNTYGVAVDTLFFCFLVDSNENDGSAEKPYYMSKNLHKMLNPISRS
ncbi:choline transporter-like 2 [Musca autumnalis]|uniref:choline transporter-like 2 n=1 Tax=Musca autumnalis TaxID=221902 RepID=UPI003CECEB5D